MSQDTNNSSLKSEAYMKYIDSLKKGESMYFDVEEIIDIAQDFQTDGQFDSALHVVETGLQQHPNDEDLELMVVLYLLYLNRLNEAAEKLEPYKEQNTPVVIHLKFGLKVLKGQERGALKMLLKHLRQHDITSYQWDYIFTDFKEDINFDVDISDYLYDTARLIDNDPNTLSNIAAELAIVNHIEEAIEIAEKTLDLDAYDIRAWQILARCHFDMQNTEKALEACEFGIAIDENNPILHFTRGYIRLLNSEYKLAIEDLKMYLDIVEGRIEYPAIDFNADDPIINMQIQIAYDIIAQAYNLNNDPQHEIEYLEKTDLYAARDPKIILRIAAALLTWGDLPMALERIEEGLEVYPKNTDMLAFKTSVLTSMHRFDEAFETLGQLNKISPRAKHFWLARAELALHLNKNDEADKAYRRLLKLKPKDKTLQELLTTYFTCIGDNDALEEIKKLG